jgi:hypothetical protein
MLIIIYSTSTKALQTLIRPRTHVLSNSPLRQVVPLGPDTTKPKLQPTPHAPSSKDSVGLPERWHRPSSHQHRTIPARSGKAEPEFQDDRVSKHEAHPNHKSQRPPITSAVPITEKPKGRVSGPATSIPKPPPLSPASSAFDFHSNRRIGGLVSGFSLLPNLPKYTPTC